MSLVERQDEAERNTRMTPLPVHADLTTGKLENGLTYVILPNRVPANRFEAHLEVLSGSANELESQQGMAHLLEHVAYMGSPKRQIISSTGARTNAYTDFHHTVFYASCPTETPDNFWKKPLMPMAFDALLDVMTTKVNTDRMEKERAAVLSEASMVNKMEYRVECQVLSALHEENRISIRFPIGKEDLIKKWTIDEVQLYHATHYRPDNVVLYVVGDVDVKDTLTYINQKFGNLKPAIDAQTLLRESGEFPPVSMEEVSPHFPPVVHRWSCKDELTLSYVPPALIKPEGMVDREEVLKEAFKEAIPKPRVYSHELLQAFSFHLFAKRPIEPITTFATLKRDIMRKIALSALQIRFNVCQRQGPLFTFVDFNQLNWPREGCAVCSLDLTTDASSWRNAVVAAVKEIRRLGIFGLTLSELNRYKSAILLETEQYAAQGDRISNEDVLTSLMEARSCSHTFMHPHERLEMTYAAVDDINLDDINVIASELCEHLSQLEPGVSPAAIIACAPVLDRYGKSFSVTESEVVEAIAEGLAEPIEPIEETVVPTTLITADELKEKVSKTKPKWVSPIPDVEKLSKNNPFGVSQRLLSNGVRVNMLTMRAEPQRVAVRLYVPGGRILEGENERGSLVLGTRTMQEGGAFSSMTREEVELFCIDHMVSVDIQPGDDALIFDFQSITTATNENDDVTGFEAVMQVLHIILTDFKFEEDAFERAKQGCYENYDMTVKGLESACQEQIILSLLENDTRFAVPNYELIDNLDLESCKGAVCKQLGPESVEVSISGDLPMDLLEKMTLNYVGTVPARPESEHRKLKSVGVEFKPLGKDKQLLTYFQDSEYRAMGYLAGPSANTWGIFADGTNLSDRLIAKANNGKEEARRKHPLFGHVVLLILQEIANRRLFSVVREERQLTYDASFQLMGLDSVHGGWYLVSVTSSPSQVQEAVKACGEALNSLKGHGIINDSVQSAKRTLLNRFRGEALNNRFWIDKLCGTQIESIPFKTIQCLTEYEAVIAGVTVQDIQLLVEELNFCEENFTSCVGITSPATPGSESSPPASPADHIAVGIGRR